jgi:hypothetical protein
VVNSPFLLSRTPWMTPSAFAVDGCDLAAVVDADELGFQGPRGITWHINSGEDAVFE